MRYIANFSLKQSHSITNVGFMGENECQITLEGRETKFLLNFSDRKIEVTIRIDEDKKEIEFECEESDLESAITNIEAFLSYIVDKGNSNRHYGCFYVEVDRFGVRPISKDSAKVNVEGNTINIKDSLTFRDSISVKSVCTKKLCIDPINHCENFPLLAYHEALRASTERLKFINLFFILEYLESTLLYKQWFLSGDDCYLFSKNTFDKCQSCLTEEQYRRMQSLINHPSYTKLSRKQKLYNFLNNLGILNITSFSEERKLSENDIGEIIQCRNLVVHSLSKLEETHLNKILYRMLFPLSENIIEFLCKNPTILNSNSER